MNGCHCGKMSRMARHSASHRGCVIIGVSSFQNLKEKPGRDCSAPAPWLCPPGVFGDFAFVLRSVGHKDGLELLPRPRGPRLAVRLSDRKLIAANLELGDRRVIASSKKRHRWSSSFLPPHCGVSTAAFCEKSWL